MAKPIKYFLLFDIFPLKKKKPLFVLGVWFYPSGDISNILLFFLIYFYFPKVIISLFFVIVLIFLIYFFPHPTACGTLNHGSEIRTESLWWEH